MSHSYNTNTTPSKQSTNSAAASVSTTGDIGGINDVERSTTPTSDSNSFIGKDKLLKQFKGQLEQFEEWNKNRDWLAFHHHHYDWWMFPINEISSRGKTFQLPDDVIIDLSNNREFISDLRRGVRLMVSSWGWDIDKRELFDKLDSNQKWSYWPVRLYKAGKSLWLFNQDDYYQSLKQYAHYIKNDKKEKLDYFAREKNRKADVLEEWNEMEHSKSF